LHRLVDENDLLDDGRRRNRIAPTKAARATAAGFFSNCSVGSPASPSANFLIKKVVEEITRELPKLSTSSRCRRRRVRRLGYARAQGGKFLDRRDDRVALECSNRPHWWTDRNIRPLKSR